MLYFFDTEFLEDGITIEPISIGICAEDERELHLEFEYDEERVNQSEFLRNNVVPHLTSTEKLNRSQVAERVLEFVGSDEDPQFWAWYASYDWIVMCQLFGRMIDLPKHFSKFVRDLRQVCAERNIHRSSLPKSPENAHNALADARWVKSAHGVVCENSENDTGYQSELLRHGAPILPVPRLEIEWIERSPSIHGCAWACRYSIIYKSLNGSVRRVPLGFTKIAESGWWPGPPEIGKEGDLPYHDGLRIRWDSKHLRLPAFVRYGDVSRSIDPLPDEWSSDFTMKFVNFGPTKEK